MFSQGCFRSDGMLYSPDLLGGIFITKVRRKEVLRIQVATSRIAELKKLSAFFFCSVCPKFSILNSHSLFFFLLLLFLLCLPLSCFFNLN